MAYKLFMFLMAVLVVGFFIAAAIAISYQNTWLIVTFLLSGFVVMGIGLTIKRKKLASK